MGTMLCKYAVCAYAFTCSFPLRLTCAELVIIRVAQGKNGKRTVLKGILGRRLSLDEPHKPISILRGIAIASGGRDDDDAILLRWYVDRRLLPRRQTLLLELVELGTQDGIKAWGGLELVGNVLGYVFGIAGGAAVQDIQRGHRCVRSSSAKMNGKRRKRIS